ncbi:MAG: hypothetical protein Q9187_000042 [Circinaria calcarea]
MSISILPPMRSVSARRPKLSLQTNATPLLFAYKSSTGLALNTATDSPTVRNTYNNAFNSQAAGSPSPKRPADKAPKPPRFAEESTPLASPSATSPASSETSPFSQSIPYTHSIVPRSILRNSPLSRRLLLATSTKSSKRIFPPNKRVVFRSNLVELIPTSVVDESSSDSDASDSSQKRGRVLSSQGTLKVDEAEFAPTTPQGRRKRRREWIWTLGSAEDGKASPDENNSPSKIATQESCLASVNSRQENILKLPEACTPILRTPSERKPGNYPFRASRPSLMTDDDDPVRKPPE